MKNLFKDTCNFRNAYYIKYLNSNTDIIQFFNWNETVISIFFMVDGNFNFITYDSLKYCQMIIDNDFATRSLLLS